MINTHFLSFLSFLYLSSKISLYFIDKSKSSNYHPIRSSLYEASEANGNLSGLHLNGKSFIKLNIVLPFTFMTSSYYQLKYNFIKFLTFLQFQPKLMLID